MSDIIIQKATEYCRRKRLKKWTVGTPRLIRGDDPVTFDVQKGRDAFIIFVEFADGLDDRLALLFDAETHELIWVR